MGKTETAASSLVMAVPAGILCYLTIMAGLGSTENMPTLLMAVVWMTAVLSFLLALFPLGVLAFMKSNAVAAAPAAGAAADLPPGEASEPKMLGAVEEGDLAETTDLGDIEEAEGDLADDEDEGLGEVEDLGNLDDDLEIDEDAFEMDDIEEEEEQPKKKKKK